jgi:hypothetical protein
MSPSGFNPYAPKVNIPRITPRVPDYEAFRRQMLSVHQPVVETGIGDGSGYAPKWGEALASKTQSPAGNDYVGKDAGGLRQGNPQRGFSGLTNSALTVIMRL